MKYSLIFFLLAGGLHAQWKQTLFPDAGQITGFASNDSILYISSEGGIFGSTDRGDHWKEVRTTSPVSCVAVLGNKLFAGTPKDGLIESIDGGKSWAVITFNSTISINSFVTKGDSIFAASNAGAEYSGDRGTDWQPFPYYSGIADRIALYNHFPVILSSSTLTVWTKYNLFSKTLCCPSSLQANDTEIVIIDSGNIFISRDTGLSWTNENAGNKFTVLCLTDSYLFAADSYGQIYFRVLSGNDWKHFPAKCPEYPITSLYFFQGSLFASVYGDLFRTDDNGVTWKEAGVGLNDRHYTVKTFAALGSSLFAGTSHGNIRSDDLGISWNNIKFQDYLFNDLITSGNELYAATSNKVYLSADAGSTWSQLDTVDQFSALSVAKIGNIVYAGSTAGLLRMDLSGSSKFFIVDTFVQEEVLTLGVAGNDLYAYAHGFAFFGDYGGLYISSDNGATWQGPVIQDATYGMVSEGENMYLATSPSTNLGTTVDYPTTGAIIHCSGAGKAIDGWSLNSAARSVTKVGQTLFAGTHDGIYRSDTPFTSWIKTPGENPPSPIISLISSGGYLFAGTGGDGLWRRPLSEFAVGQNIPDQFTLIENSPNPFDTRTMISFSLAQREFVVLKIFDPLGKEICTLVNGFLEPGTHQAEWIAWHYPPGMYFYQIRAGNFSGTKTLIKL